ncbi:MAG: ExbD/TolR family protein [Sulfurihydrogenibium sp.]|uniref:ExbD/TolR family protein n=1 Tax=Sulfurihydrogenibium sp. TaxID=2053621 RepID=UPI003D128885
MDKDLIFLIMEEDTLEKEEIQIIPMIDVMLFLLVFFMLYTINVVPALVQNINVPTSSTVQPAERKEPITIYITSRGEIYYNKDKVSLDGITERLSSIPDKVNQNVIIVSDKEVKMQTVIDVIDAVKKAGISKLGLAGEKK